MTAAIGSQADALARLLALVPSSWFKSPDPEVQAILNGFASNEAYVYSLIQYMRAQSRLWTTTDGFLDIAAWDFFGSAFLRRPAEPDASFAPRLIAELTRPRITRASIVSALKSLTGNTPAILEPWNTGDCGALNVGTLALAGSTPGVQNGAGIGGLALGANNGCLYVKPTAALFSGGAGAVGSLALTNQFFVTLRRPGYQGVPNISGIGSVGGGLGVGAFSLITPSQIVAAVTDQDIYNTINSTKAAGTTAWVNLTAPGVDPSVFQSPTNSGRSTDSGFDSSYA